METEPRRAEGAVDLTRAPARSRPGPRHATDPATADHAIITTDAGGRVRSWSQGAELLYGWSAAEAVGATLADLIGAADRRAVRAMQRAVARHGSWSGIIHATPRGGNARRVEVHAAGLPTGSGEPAAIVAAHLDLSRREQARVTEGQVAFQSALLERIGSILVAGDARNRVIHWNSAAADAYGYSPEQALGRHIDSLLPADNSAERRRHRRSLRAGQVVRVDVPITRPDGRIVMVNSVTAPIHDAEGRYQGWISVGHDVTELRMSDARLAAVVEAAPFGVALTDATMGLTYVNPAAAEIAGASLDQLRAHGWVEAIHPDDRERMVSVSQQAIASGRSVRVAGRTLRADGGVRHFAAEIIPIVLAGGVAGTAVVVFQVPDRSLGTLSDATRAHVLDEIDNAVVVTGLDGVVRYWNAAAERRFGWPASDIVGRRTAEFGIISDPRAVEAMTDGLMRAGRWVGEIAHTRRDGTSGEAYVTTSLVLDPEGRPESIVTVSADMDPIKDRRAALELQSQVVASIDAGMWLLDPSTTRMEFVNAGYERMLGLRLEDLQADPWSWLARVHPDDLARVRGAVEANPMSVDVEYRIQAEPGSSATWRHVQGRTVAIAAANGGVQWVAGIVTDITSLRSAESQLLRMGTAIEQSRDGVLMVDADWRAVYANEAFETITGYRRDEIIGRQPVELVGGIDGARPPFGDIVDATIRGETWTGALETTRADGQPLLVDLSVWPIPDPGGATSSIVAVLRERSDERRLLATMERQVRDRAIVGAAMARIEADASIEETADVLIGPALELDGIEVAALVAFTNGKLVVPLAARGPGGAPVQAGRPMPGLDAAWLRRVAGEGAVVRSWVPDEHVGDLACRWTELGVTAIAHAPLTVDGTAVGLLIAGSRRADAAAVLTGHLPTLTEYAAMTTARIGPQLRQLRETEDRRSALAEVIRARAFHTVFQPIVELRSRKIIGYEALTRFTDGVRPDLRFTEADALGMGFDLEEAAATAACEAADALPERAWVSLNVSPAFATEGARLRRLLRNACRMVVLEITERTTVDDYAALRRRVAQLGDGVRLAVDDAGAGFASLRHIIELRPDFVKLDMGLVRNIGADAARKALVAGMVHFAAESGCVLIAEGIEAEAERRALRRLGVTLGQGYLLGQPEAVVTESESVA